MFPVVKYRKAILKGAIARQVSDILVNCITSAITPTTLKKKLIARTPIVKATREIATWGPAAKKHAVPVKTVLAPNSVIEFLQISQNLDEPIPASMGREEKLDSILLIITTNYYHNKK